MSTIAKDYTGERFGKLVVLGFSHREVVSGTTRVKWKCRCDCGRETIVNSCHLKKAKGCGCLKKQGRPFNSPLTKTIPEYNVWCSMITRCSNPDCKAYKNYGLRGITVCSRWQKSFEAFLENVGRRPSDKHSIDRIDNNKGYFPENCKWSTRSEQAQNKRKRENTSSIYKGVSFCKQTKKWAVYIRVEGKTKRLGSFSSEFEAALAYDSKARELNHAAYRLNFPNLQVNFNVVPNFAVPCGVVGRFDIKSR